MPPLPAPGTKAAKAGKAATLTGAAIASDALRYVGAGYVYGGNASRPGDWDCCLVPGSLVQTTAGPVRIEDIAPGDEVYSWDEGSLAVRKVLSRSRPRRQPVYRLRTVHREITASGNHPFLVVRREASPSECSEAGCSRTPRGRGLCGMHYQRWAKANPDATRQRGKSAAMCSPEWVRLDQLRHGDIVVMLAGLPDDAPVPLDRWQRDPDYLWLLGAMLADGTMSVRAQPNRFDLCLYDDNAEHAEQCMVRLAGRGFGCRGHKHGLVGSHAGLAAAFRRDGCGVGSPYRRVPPWVWSLPHPLIEQFLAGYAMDGYRDLKGGQNYSSASRGMIEDVRNLHMILGHNVGQIGKTERTKPIIIKGKTVKNALPLWFFITYPESVRRAQGLFAQNRGLRQVFPHGSRFRPARVQSIEAAGESDTYDLTIDGTHNFVADGLVVHNSSFVSYVLGHDLGLALPGGKWGAPGFPPGSHGPVVLSYAGWSATSEVATPAAGDLCIWAGAGANGHIGIATGPSSMVSALNPSDGTKVTPILGTGPSGVPLSFRRVSGLAAGAGSVGAGLSGTTSGGGVVGAIGRFLLGVGEIPARLAAAALIVVSLPFIIVAVAALAGTVLAFVIAWVFRKAVTA